MSLQNSTIIDMAEIALSASLVLYKSDLKDVKKTLLALQEAGQFAKAHYPMRLSLTLVDNSDDCAIFDQVARWLESVRIELPDWELSLLRAPGNIGYGRGNNLVIDKALSDYHLVLNPDLFVRVDALFEAIRYMQESAEVGLLTPSVFGEDGKRHYLCKRNPTLLVMFLRSFAPKWVRSAFGFVLNEFEMRDCDYEKEIHPVEYPTGCFMFFRTSRLHEIQGFDPKIFLHYEDADIGRRMLAVAKVNYVPSVMVTHKWNRETHKSLRAKMITVVSGWYYWRKWRGLISTGPMSEPVKSVSNGKIDPEMARAVGQGQRVLVTGANGFIGSAACHELPSYGFKVFGVTRNLGQTKQAEEVAYLEMCEIDECTDWTTALSGVDSVVHLIAKVHAMEELSAVHLAEYRRVNVDLTMNLAHQAVAAGVRRFVFVSSIKVNGESTPVGQPFTAEDIPKPKDSYGISKFEAEQALMELAKKTGLEVVIIRPPLVYGIGVKANFETMMRWVAREFPLPFGALNSRRSLVAVDNLISMIATCLSHPCAANQRFLVSDGDDLTVTELMRRIAESLNKSVILAPVPAFLLRMTGGMVGKREYVDRILTSLQVDIKKNQSLLGWSPPVRVSAALRKAALGFSM